MKLIHHQSQGVFQRRIPGVPHGEMTAVAKALPLFEVGPVADGDDRRTVFRDVDQIVHHRVGGIQLRPLQKVGQRIGGEEPALQDHVADLQRCHDMTVFFTHIDRSFTEQSRFFALF